ncbi:hypothetical protein ABT381_29665 [Streptomyces sp. NPDC000151]|uniref:hypothetical protein n=1 Tax=Streptomyces sp. NPDC000151 TaxID=3154244 RepID=UPI00331D5B52
MAIMTPAGARRAGLATAVAASLCVLAGCGLPGLDRPEPKAKPTQPSFAEKAPLPSAKPLGPDAHVPEEPKPDRRDATAVAKAWALVAYSYDTKYDMSPHDAILRAVPYLTGKKAKEERGYHPAAGAGNEWNTWAKHKAWTKVKLHLEVDGDAPADTSTKAHRQISVSGTATGRDEWRGVGPRVQAFVTLVRSDAKGDWQVSRVDAVPAAAVPSAPPSSSGQD